MPTRGTFERVAIVDRGDAAMRFIHAAREVTREGGPPVRTIALVRDADRASLFAREADHVHAIGPADAGSGLARLADALRATRAEAVWVGWGAVAASAALAELCDDLGLVHIGPGAGALRTLGDRIGARRLAEATGIPVVPWSDGPVTTLDAAVARARRLGYPLVVKANAARDGHGIRTVREERGLAAAFADTRAEADAAFGDDTVFLERLIARARVVEVQIVADHHGTVWACGVRDRTVQSGRRTLLAETPCATLRREQEASLRDAAVRLVRAGAWVNVGSVEFLLDVAGNAHFLGLTPHLPSEHPVTEMTTGLDLVKLQIAVARGDRLPAEPPPAHGHAVAVRLTGERGPMPATIALFRPPTGAGIRVDAGVVEGDTTPAGIESTLATLSAYGRTRAEALARLRRALADTDVVVRGGTSNATVLRALLECPELLRDEVDNGWLDRIAITDAAPERRGADVAIMAAAIEAYAVELSATQARFRASAARGRAEVPREIGRVIELRHGGHVYRVDVARLGGDRHSLTVDGRTIAVRADARGSYERRYTVGDLRHRGLVVPDGAGFQIEIDGRAHRVSRDDGGPVRAPGPAVVAAVFVAEGDTVAPGQRLVVLESMKMETTVAAPYAGRVRAVLVRPNMQVPTGAPLVVLEPRHAGDTTPPARDRIAFHLASAPPPAPGDACRRTLAGLADLVLGFDVTEAEAAALVAAYSTLAVAPDDPVLLAGEDALLARFVDVQSLFGRRRDPAAPDDRDPTTDDWFLTYLRGGEARAAGLPAHFVERLQRALAHYHGAALRPPPADDEALLWLYLARERVAQQVPAIGAVLTRRLAHARLLAPRADAAFAAIVQGLIEITEDRLPTIASLAMQVAHRYLERPLLEHARQAVYADADARLAACVGVADPSARAEHLAALVDCPHPLVGRFAARLANASASRRAVMLDVLVRRYYRIRSLERVGTAHEGEPTMVSGSYALDGRRVHVVATHATLDGLDGALAALAPVLTALPAADDVVVDVVCWHDGRAVEVDALAARLQAAVARVALPRPLRRLVVIVAGPGSEHAMAATQHLTFRHGPEGLVEDRLWRGLHPMMGKRLQLWRLAHFDLTRLPSTDDVYLFHGSARDNPRDERLFACVEVRDLTPVRDAAGRVVELPHLEHMLAQALADIREVQRLRPPAGRLYWNRVLLYVWPPLTLSRDELTALVERLAPRTAGVGLEKVVVRARVPSGGALRDTVIHITNPAGRGLALAFRDPADQPIRPLTAYGQKVVKLRQRGLVYPYEILRLLAPPSTDTPGEFPPGEFVEHDFDAEGRLVPVDRPPGQNTANLVVGLVRNVTAAYPEGMTRVILLGDPSRGMGALAEPECRRIDAAVTLATERRIPLEWFAVSAGARISMESGTENMDWIARVLRRLIEFTQAGGEVNVVVLGINVGAQPYWNAEATMLMHTKGILVMTPDGAMVLTGKQALDYSGSVSAEDNFGIGGYDRIMGRNGQAQYRARDLTDACRILLRHYEHTYVAPGERFPRRVPTRDQRDRDVCTAPLDDAGGTVGDILLEERNPGRKRPFEVRRIMQAAIDQDHPPLERWAAMRDAEVAVVWDAHLDGQPICVLGIESHPLPRFGFVPGDGPEQWTAGTLFPRASKKIARAVNAASGNRPLVVLANLSGFDGSPESMRRMQLEYGAEIGRAVVNFDGPIVFCVISRYHGGAFVVFSRALNERLEAIALEGTYASVIGGAPAAAVVFAGEVDTRTREDPRVQAAERALAAAPSSERLAHRAALEETRLAVRSEKLGDVATEFDRVHSVGRALAQRSLDRIVPPRRLRPELIDAVERGMRRILGRAPS